MRRSAIWDCGFPLVAPQTQYSSSGFAMPIRRVFGGAVFGLHETLDMPPPGDMRAGSFHVRVIDPAWHFGYGPLARYVGERLDAQADRSVVPEILEILLDPQCPRTVSGQPAEVGLD